MNEFSTPDLADRAEQTASPRLSTINIIKQFARLYVPALGTIAALN